MKSGKSNQVNAKQLDRKEILLAVGIFFGMIFYSLIKFFERKR